jgi:hypothetical protein
MGDLKAVLAKAADLIEQHGWIQGDYGNPDTGFCAAGAIWWAIAGRKRDISLETSPHNGSFVAALDMLPYGVGGAASWNDNPRTTKEDVIQALRKAAA